MNVRPDFKRAKAAPKAAKPLRRKARLATAKTRMKPGRRRERDETGEARWKRALGRECSHPDCPGDESLLVQHHVVYAQKVRRVGGDVYDPRNSLTLDDSCHSSHHRRGSRVIPLSALTDANYAFAEELLGGAAYDYLRRRYVGADPRLDAIRARYYATSDADRR